MSDLFQIIILIVNVIALNLYLTIYCSLTHKPKINTTYYIKMAIYGIIFISGILLISYHIIKGLQHFFNSLGTLIG